MSGNTIRSKLSSIIYSGGIFLFLVVLSIFFQFMSGRSLYPEGGLIDWWSNGRFFTGENFINILCQTSINTIIGVGMTMVIITAGIDLSVGAVLALSGVISMAIIMTGFPPQCPYPSDTFMKPEWPLAASVPVAITAAALIGAVCGLHNAIPIIKLRVPPFIATLAMFSIARGFAQIYVNGGQVGNLPEAFADAFGSNYLLPSVALSTVAIGHIILRYTKFGRAVYAVGGNEQAARLSGINIGRIKLWVYIICGTLAGIAGFLLAGRIGAGEPKAGLSYELNAIAAVVLGGTSLAGGVGTVIGTLMGAIVIGCLETGLTLMGVQSFVQMVVKGYVILLAVVLDQMKKRRK